MWLMLEAMRIASWTHVEITSMCAWVDPWKKRTSLICFRLSNSRSPSRLCRLGLFTKWCKYNLKPHTHVQGFDKHGVRRILRAAKWPKGLAVEMTNILADNAWGRVLGH